MSRKQLKARDRAIKAEARAAAKVAAEAADGDQEKPQEVDAAFGETDWSTPWWEVREPASLAD